MMYSLGQFLAFEFEQTFRVPTYTVERSLQSESMPSKNELGFGPVKINSKTPHIPIIKIT